jgi:hypothetical protein
MTRRKLVLWTVLAMCTTVGLVSCDPGAPANTDQALLTVGPAHRFQVVAFLCPGQRLLGLTLEQDSAGFGQYQEILWKLRAEPNSGAPSINHTFTITFGIPPRGFVTVVPYKSIVDNPPVTIYLTMTRETWGNNFFSSEVRTGQLLGLPGQYFSMAQFLSNAKQLC